MTTITREHLELAALAAGMTYQGSQWSSLAMARDGVWQSWRPHTDIADAARLADSLGMRVSNPKHVGDGVLVEAAGIVPMTVFRSDRTRQYCEAVTLCAAQIGRPALTAQEIERGDALPRRGSRSAGAGARSGAGGPAGV